MAVVTAVRMRGEGELAMAHVTRRQGVIGVASGFALPFVPANAAASQRCVVSRDGGGWQTSLELLRPSREEKELKPDDMLVRLVVAHGDVEGDPVTPTQPAMGLRLTLLRKANEFAKAELRVSPDAYTGRSVHAITSPRQRSPSRVDYWPVIEKQQRGGLQFGLEHRDGDRPYFTMTHGDGRWVRFEGEFELWGPQSTRNALIRNLDRNHRLITARFEVSELGPINQAVYFLRHGRRIDLESGVIRQSGDRIALCRRSVSTLGFGDMFRSMQDEFNARGPNFDRGKCRAQGCFLTTACCVVMGRPDDGFELTTLRAFRDGWLLRQPSGREVVAEYYALAPAIADALMGDAEGRRRLRALYWRTILPCVAAVKLGLNSLAYLLYRRMITRLAS
jgi:hypothetical protein